MQKLNWKLLAARTLLVVSFSSIALSAQTADSWQIGPFTRPSEGNPVISPRPESTFADPVLKAPAHWEALHTFNPAAIVRDNKVYLIYRAEDDSGAMEIGGHTSRLGLAESEDGLHFTRHHEPVFFLRMTLSRRASGPAALKIPALLSRRTAPMCSPTRSGTGKPIR